MEKIRAFLPDFSQLSRRERALVFAAAALLLALIVITCVSINMRVNMQREYTALRSQLGESLYTNLSMLAQTYDMTTVPNADIQNAILPQMRNYFVASATLNEALTKSFGQRYQLLTEADVNSLRAAFTAYDNAVRNDTPTDLALSDLQICITRVRELLNSRYSEGVLRASR